MHLQLYYPDFHTSVARCSDSSFVCFCILDFTLSVQISTDLGAQRGDWILCYDMLTDFVHLTWSMTAILSYPQLR